MKKRIFTVLIAAVMTFSLAACQGMPSGKEDKESSDSGSDSLTMPPKSFGSEDNRPTPVPEGVLDEETAQRLYNIYIDINNAMLGRINDSLIRYFTYVDVESEEFKLLDESDNYYTCYSLSSPLSDVEEAYEILNGKSEKDTLDQAFLDMYPSITNLLNTLNEISDYTSPQTYLEDNFAKSQEQHTALLNALAEYYTTGDIFLTELDIVADARQQESLEMMKNEGYVVFYSLNMVINLGKDILDELYVENVWDDNILDMDLTKIKPLYEEFCTYADALLAYDDDQEALQAEGLSNSAYWSIFIMNMKSTRDSIAKVIAKVEAGEALSEFDLAITSVSGQCNLSSFSTGVSDMIDSYNRL